MPSTADEQTAGLVDAVEALALAVERPQTRMMHRVKVRRLIREVKAMSED